jgi:hypothetical protein
MTNPGYDARLRWARPKHRQAGLPLCGGNRSRLFVGAGLPPSPVTRTVPIGGRPVTQERSRIFWQPAADK